MAEENVNFFISQTNSQASPSCFWCVKKSSWLRKQLKWQFVYVEVAWQCLILEVSDTGTPKTMNWSKDEISQVKMF